MKCLRVFFQGARWGGIGERAVTRKGRGTQEWLQNVSLYSAKINSTDHNCFMMLVNTEFCMALTDTIT